MKKRKIRLGQILLFVLALSLFIAWIILQNSRSAPPDQPLPVANATSTRGEERELLPQKTAKLRELLALHNSNKNAEKPVSNDPWSKVPAELNKLMDQQELDLSAPDEYLQTMESFLQDYDLADTYVQSVKCVADICRLTQVHENPDAFQKYLKHQTFLSLSAQSNYFSSEEKEDDKVQSHLWLGRNGYVLPFQEIYKREKFISSEPR